MGCLMPPSAPTRTLGQESEAPSVDGATGGLANVPGQDRPLSGVPLAELRGDIEATIAFASLALVGIRRRRSR